VTTDKVQRKEAELTS